MQFIGNKKIADFLQFSLKNGAFGHAHCLVGVSQIGKRTLSKILAAQILGIEMRKLNTSTDFVYVERLEDEKSGKKKKDITVEQIRELREKFYQSSWGNGHKVAVIDEAELLNDESGNALLKMLEEPPQNSVIFLLTEDDNRLLPTVRSRCQSFQLSTVSDQEINDWLLSLNCDKSQADEIVKLAWGRPGLAKNLFEDAEIYSHCFEEQQRFEKLLSSPIYLRWQLVENLFGEKVGQVKTKEILDPVLNFWIMMLRSKMVQEKSAKFGGLIDEINKIKNMLAANVNPKLAVEELLTKF